VRSTGRRGDGDGGLKEELLAVEVGTGASSVGA
jgi:hypothetical protein